MDRISAIVGCQWRAFWRRFRRSGHLGAGNQAIVLIGAVLFLARFLQSLHRAALDLPQSKTRVFESLLLVIFVVWLFPLTSNARINIATRKLLHLPLSASERFAIKLLNFFIPPYAWVIAIGSLAICYPTIYAPHPLGGILAALLFVAFSMFTGITIAQLLSLAIWRKLFFAILLLAGALVVYLVQTGGREQLTKIFSASPVSLVSRAALGLRPAPAIIELALLTAVAALAAVWSFRKTLEVPASRRTQKISALNVLRIPGPVGGLAAKDFRYFRRLLDPYLGVLVAALGSLFLISAEVVSLGLFLGLLVIVIFPSAALAFNLFGLDNRGVMDRLKIMPVTGKTILLSKNVAFLMIVGAQVAPLILLASWRLGLLAGALGSAQAVSLTAMYSAWGNWMSLNHPAKIHFFQFSSSSGLIVEVLAGFMFGSLPGVINIYFLQTGGTVAAVKVLVVLVCSGLVYFVSLSRFGSQFLVKEESIRNAVS
ncbi:MAG TPA: hypothetical protein VLL54_06990 [Pyrinomonadaceae bacterium]|nr:hypothetical protein [Pyrinomonadaceae bacterium]